MSAFDESQVNRQSNGEFGVKPQSAPEIRLAAEVESAGGTAPSEVTLDHGGRAELLARARQLRSKSYELSRNRAPASEVKALQNEASRLVARPARKNPPLPRMRLQPMNRSVLMFFDRDREDFDLTPPYQRGSVWTLEQRRALFESLLRGLPVGSLVINDRTHRRDFDYAEELPFAVVDGKQRIETLRAFRNDEFTLPADWFGDEDVLDETDDGEVAFSGLSAVGKRTIQNLTISTIEARVDTVEEEARIFDLINSAGAAQTDADLARARSIAG